MAYDSLSAENGSQPSHVQGGFAEILLTPGDYFRNNPAKQQQYFKKWGLRPTFLHKMKVLGFSRGTQARYMEHWEEKQVKEHFKIGSVVTPAGGAGQVIVLAIDASDMLAMPDNMGTTQYGSRPRATETFITASRTEYRIESKNEGVNPHQITVKPVDDGVNANTELVAAASVYIVSPIKAEATGQVKGLISLPYKYTNTFAIVDETDLVSGTGLTIRAPYEAIQGKPGYFYVKNQEDAEMRFERSKSNRMFWGTKFDNASQYSDPFGKTFKIPGTEGVLEFATTYGLDDTFANIGAYTLEDLFGITNYYADLQMPYGDLVVMQGSEIGAKTDILLKDFVSDSCVDYVGDSYMGGALAAARMDAPQYNYKKLFVNFGFKGVALNGYNIIFTGLNEFNIPVPGFKFKQWQLVAPMGLFTDKNDTNRTMPTIGYEYKTNPEIGYSRENEIWRTGGAGPASMVNKCSEFDVMNSFYRFEGGPHLSHGQYWLVQRPLA